jgi:uncharacterized protein (TIGR03435 family)
MKKFFSGMVILLTTLLSYSQEAVLSQGSRFPDILITNISNAPVRDFNLHKEKSSKYYILNFWGTWCSPCIPEMDSLSVLLKNNADKIGIIAISDDNEERKNKYLKNKPSKIWLATDTSYTLYKMFNFAFVGQSAIIGPDKKVVALVRTDSINQQLLDKLFKGEPVKMSAGIREAAIKTDDPFGIDSLTQHSFTLRGYLKGHQTMGRMPKKGVYGNRRLSYYNITLRSLYRTAYEIKSHKAQEFYDEGVTEKDISDYENKNTLYCLDLLIPENSHEKLLDVLKKKLNDNLSIKVRQEQKEIEVYVLKRINADSFKIPVSTAEESMFGFSGKGFDGTKNTLKEFAEEYLSNELGLPVVDETGLTGFYDIKTNVEQRNRAGIMQSIEQLGLSVEKTTRLMPVIYYYR